MTDMVRAWIECEHRDDTLSADDPVSCADYGELCGGMTEITLERIAWCETHDSPMYTASLFGVSCHHAYKDPGAGRCIRVERWIGDTE